jgi:hypothetical protein
LGNWLAGEMVWMVGRRLDGKRFGCLWHERCEVVQFSEVNELFQGNLVRKGKGRKLSWIGWLKNRIGFVWGCSRGLGIRVRQITVDQSR